jgi:DNA-binding transcriptional ArsR family regulator
VNEKLEIRDQRPGWFWMANKLFEGMGAVLGPSGIAVYAYLCKRASNNGQDCWPSLATIAGETGMSKSGVVQQLKVLEAAGMVVRQRRMRNGNEYRYTSSLYILTSRDKWNVEAALALRNKQRQKSAERRAKAEARKKAAEEQEYDG